MLKLVKNWATATLILCFLVIIAGGVVRTTQSGMGCPDWPKCFGKWIPPTNVSELPLDYEKYLRKQDIDHTFNAFHTWIEYINRLLGVLLGVFGIIQVALLFFHRKQFLKVFKLAIAFLALVILTGLFGAIVVKLNLAHVSISVHLLFAIILVQVQLAAVLSIKANLFKWPVQPQIRKWVFTILVLLFCQSVLGTVVRMNVDDISKALNYTKRETWLAQEPIVFLIHRSFSWLVLLGSLYMTWYCRKTKAVKTNALILSGIVILSMILGIVLYYFDMPAAAQPAHLFLAALAITQAVAILLKTKNA